MKKSEVQLEAYNYACERLDLRDASLEKFGTVKKNLIRAWLKGYRRCYADQIDRIRELELELSVIRSYLKNSKILQKADKNIANIKARKMAEEIRDAGSRITRRHDRSEREDDQAEQLGEGVQDPDWLTRRGERRRRNRL